MSFTCRLVQDVSSSSDKPHRTNVVLDVQQTWPPGLLVRKCRKLDSSTRIFVSLPQDMIFDGSSVTALIERLVAAVRISTTVNWSDARVDVIVIVSGGLGAMLGAYLHSVLAKRGKIAAIRNDLGQAIRLQESILESVSRQLWTDHDLANLKRDTYQGLNRTLSLLGSELSSILGDCIAPDGTTSDPVPASTSPGGKEIAKRLDEFKDLLIPAHIALSQESVNLVMRFQSEAERLRQLTDVIPSYGYFVDLQCLADDTRKKLFETARADLHAPVPD
jgi:hypothetical protein